MQLFLWSPPLCSVHQQHIVTSTVLCQIYEHGRGLAFHFDKDEHLLKEEGTMVHPIVNSIIYLTGDSAKSRQGVDVGTRIHNCIILCTFQCIVLAERKGKEQDETGILLQARSS